MDTKPGFAHLSLAAIAGSSTPATQAVSRSVGDAELTAAYAEGRKDEAAEERYARMDMALRQVFYSVQFEQLCPGTFNAKACEELIRKALTTDTGNT